MWLPLLLGLFTLLTLYAPGLHEEFFNIDDRSLIAIPQVRAGFDFELLKTWFTPGAHIDFYPLRDISYWADVHCFGGDVGGADAIVFRLQNFAWVFTSAVALALILGHFLENLRIGVWISCFWFIHPIHSELLMWPSARKDCMALALGLISVVQYIKSYETEKKRFAFLALFFFVLSLLSKATFSLLPLCVPVVAIAMRDSRIFKKQSVRVWLPALILGVAFAFFQSRFYTRVNDMRFFYPPTYRVQGAMTALGRIILGLILPRYNAVDVETWGDWVSRNLMFLPMGVAFFGASLGLTIYAVGKRINALLYSMFGFWLLYLPVCAGFF